MTRHEAFRFARKDARMDGRPWYVFWRNGQWGVSLEPYRLTDTAQWWRIEPDGSHQQIKMPEQL